MFQGRISKLETKIDQLENNNTKEQPKQSPSEQPARKSNESLIKSVNCQADIHSPRDNDSAEQNILVSGTFSGTLSPLHLWLVVHPKNSPGWWPQVGEIITDPHNGNWDAPARLSNTDDAGELFDIAVILADEDAHDSFYKYIQKGKETNMYPEQPLPCGARLLTIVTVKRK